MEENCFFYEFNFSNEIWYSDIWRYNEQTHAFHIKFSKWYVYEKFLSNFEFRRFLNFSFFTQIYLRHLLLFSVFLAVLWCYNFVTLFFFGIVSFTFFIETLVPYFKVFANRFEKNNNWKRNCLKRYIFSKHTSVDNITINNQIFYRIIETFVCFSETMSQFIIR